MNATGKFLDAFAILHEAIVDEDAVSLPEQELSFLFYLHRQFFLRPDHKDMQFFEGFAKKPPVFLDGLIVDFDGEGSQKLVELVFNRVFFNLADL